MESLRPRAHTYCMHCGQAINAPGERFCCSGCSTVFSFLKSRGLLHYYDLKNQASFAPAKPFRGSLAVPKEDSNQEGTFLLEGLHCLGCLWLLEKLPEIEKRILSVTLDIGQSTIRIQRQPSISWAETTKLLSQLGYGARLVDSVSFEQEKTADERRQLWRVALAAFAAGNIMTWSAALYAGADASWAGVFSSFSAVFGIPVVTYCAWPIYRAGFRPLFNRVVSLDLPIALAILGGTILSLWHLVGGGSEHYFDSLAMLVFLLLSSRYYLLRTQKKYSQNSRFLRFLEDETIERTLPHQGLTSPSDLMPGETFLLETGRILPCDSRSINKTGLWNLASLTGESQPQAISIGELVESGAKNEGEAIEMQVERKASESRIQTLFCQMDAFSSLRSPTLSFTQRLAPWFALGVILAATGAFIVGSSSVGVSEGISRALALIVVTCPCVIAFIVPLTLSKAMERAAQQGLLVKEAGSLERLADARTFCFDKTGTLTMGRFEVLRWEGKVSEEDGRALAALEDGSQHPVGRALFQWAKERAKGSTSTLDGPAVPMVDGIRGTIGGTEWCIRRVPGAPGENSVGLFAGGSLRARFALGDSPRPETQGVLTELRAMGARLLVLTGDTAGNTAPLMESLGIGKWEAGLSPEQKALRLSQLSDAIMIGDGANDAAAFRVANVGIAVQGAMAQSLLHSDMALTVLGLKGLPTALKLARKTKALIRLSFALTFSYNLVAGTLAFFGLMNPLLAALLMPLSAASVFLLNQWFFLERAKT